MMVRVVTVVVESELVGVWREYQPWMIAPTYTHVQCTTHTYIHVHVHTHDCTRRTRICIIHTVAQI